MLEHIDLLFYKLRYLVYGLFLLASLLLVLVFLSIVSNHMRTPARDSELSTGFLMMHIPDSANAVTNAAVSGIAGLEQAMVSADDALNSGVRSGVMSVVHSGKAVAGSGRFIGHGIYQVGALEVRYAQRSAAFVSRTANNSIAIADRSIIFVGKTTTGGVALLGKTIGGGIALAGKTVGSSLLFIGMTAGKSVAFVFHIPVNILGFVSHEVAFSAIIKPSSHTSVPVINSPPASLFQKTAALSAAQPASVSQPAPAPAAPAPSSEAIWPIHGAITTLFGVPHWPYQPTHTGLDISDGRPAGVTPVKAFKPGRVLQTINSYSGFGNHVLIDHGGGLVSLYGHLASIAVQPGQAVDTTTTVGMEGSTGASTGTHLHFEIRVNGQPVDPLQFVSGRP